MEKEEKTSKVLSTLIVCLIIFALVGIGYTIGHLVGYFQGIFDTSTFYEIQDIKEYLNLTNNVNDIVVMELKSK